MTTMPSGMIQIRLSTVFSPRRSLGCPGRSASPESLGHRDLASEDGTGRALDRKGTPLADDAQRAAAQANGHGGCTHAALLARRGRSDDGARATCQRLAAAALESANQQ